MPKDIQLKSFSGGMNKDMDYSILPENTYVDAQNFKLIANEDSNGFILENSEGNNLEYNLTNIATVDSTYKIAGHCFIKPYLVVFLTQNLQERTPDGDSSGKFSKIVRFTIDRGRIQNTDLIYTDGGTKEWLNLSMTYPIKAIGNYESDDIIKVYWTDGYNELRFCNIMDSGLSSQSVSKFSFIMEFQDLSSGKGASAGADSRPEFVELVSGNLKASTVQYTYQLYNVNEAATKFAPVSAPIAIPFSNVDADFKLDYRGGQQDEECNKGCKIKVDIPTSKEYDRIRLVALDYSTLTSVPVVRVFGEYAIDLSNSNTELYFTDIGTTLDEIVFEDFLIYGSVNYTAKDLEVKNNRLFIANLKEDTFDVDFDARAYRFNASNSSRVYDSDLVNYYTINSSGGWTYSGGGSGSDWSIPEDADCINVYNSPDYETNASYYYIYQSDGSTYGAEGKNVYIELKTDSSLQIDNTGLTTGNFATYEPDSGESTAFPYNMAYKRSFQRQEVYRLGLVFFNKKLQASPVKWMCDVKMPNHGDSSGSFAFTSSSGNDTTAKLLGIEVTLKNHPSDEYYAFQIVRVPRESQDRSVLANALLQTPVLDTGVAHPDSDRTSGTTTVVSLTRMDDLYNTSGNHEPKLSVLISPEINFNQNLEYQSGDFLSYLGYFPYIAASNSFNTTARQYSLQKLIDFNGTGSYVNSGHTAEITDFRIIGQTVADDLEYEVGGLTYNNYAKNVLGDKPGLHGTCGLAYTPNELQAGSANDKVMLVSYRRNNFNSQYGGIGYYERQRNTYVGCSKLYHYSLLQTPEIETYEGDTFIDFFSYQKQAIDLEDQSNSWMVSVLFPIESSIANTLRFDKPYYRYPSSAAIYEGTLIRETAGTYEATINTVDLTLNQELDLYQYNSVYSMVSRGNIYTDTILDESDQTRFPIRVRNSEVKENNEIQDSFTIFKSNNFIDVNGKHGPINNLLNFKNQLYFWQDTSFGILSVNTRSLIEDNNPGVLALGTGGILDRYDYISNTTGNTNPYGIISSNKALYWVDNDKNEIFRYSGNEESISKISGLQSWINEKGKIGYVIGSYDTKYNDVVFTLMFSKKLTCFSKSGDFGDNFVINDNTGVVADASYRNVVVNGTYADTVSVDSGRNNLINYSSGYWHLVEKPYADIGGEFYVTFLEEDSSNRETVVYNERLSKFVSFASFEPRKYIECDNSYFTTVTGIDLYEHNSDNANRGEYYGVVYNSSVSTVFNKDYPFTKAFDVIKWVSDSRDSNNINIFKDTFDEVTIYNDYQNTGDRKLYYQHDTAPVYARVTPLSRRERTWSMQVPRNIVNADVDTNPDIQDSNNWDETLSNKGRMKDKYLLCDFVYDNTNAYTFSVPFISNIFRRSYR
jgi:hypothetical protein